MLTLQDFDTQGIGSCKEESYLKKLFIIDECRLSSVPEICPRYFCAAIKHGIKLPQFSNNKRSDIARKSNQSHFKK